MDRTILEQSGLDAHSAARVASQLESLRKQHAPAECWRLVTESVLRPEHPPAVHRAVWDYVFESWRPEDGPRPAWIPSPEQIGESNIGRLIERLRVRDYVALREWAARDRAGYWDVALRTLGIRFRQAPARILEPNCDARGRWLSGAKLNITESCFQSSENDIAIVYSTADNSLRRQSYGELRRLCHRVSNGLRRAGFMPGDALAVLMPMTPESVAIYLGIIAAGYVVVSIADSFAPAEIQTRLNIAQAKGVFCISSHVRAGKRLPLYEKLSAAEAPRVIVIDAEQSPAAALRPGDMCWSEFLSDDDEFEALACSPEDTINILFSSGTTGEPKAIPWDHTTPIKCAADAHFHQDVHPGDVVAWPSSLGWMMGPWLIFAALINRATIALFHDVPTTREFGRFVQDAGVNMLGVVPTLVRGWRETRCMEGLDWKHLRAFSSTGEASDPQDMFYLMGLAGYRPVIEYCGGTELGGGYIASTVVQPNCPSVFSTPTLGLDFVIVDDAGNPSPSGELFLVPPSIGMSSRLLNRDHDSIYLNGAPLAPDGRRLRRHGDCFETLPNGYYRALGRADDTMNLGGIKVGCAEIERVLNRVDGVKETAAVVAPGDGPSKLVVFAVTAADAPPVEELHSAMQRALSQELNPLFKIHDVRVVDTLPRTASNKVMRKELRAAYTQA